jgi:FkbM family methyltransferase
MKYLIQSLVRKIGLDVRRVGDAVDTSAYLANRNIDIVLDVGANVGQFAGMIRRKGYKGRIISFEPVSAAFTTLRNVAKDDGNWEVQKLALGEAEGTNEINVSRNTQFSSIATLTRAAITFDPAAATVTKETISICTLDNICKNLAGNIFLKIDTQGFEKQVLLGGARTLPGLKGILMELPIVHLYEGIWKLEDALKYMNLVGFVPAQISPVNYHPKDRMSLVEVDCLFRPRDPRLD